MKVLVAGSSGLAGSAIFKAFARQNYEVIGINRQVCNLLDESATVQFVNKIKPNILIDAAAKVGGINANDKFPVNFFTENIKIQNNLMLAAHLNQVEKFVFLGSSCIYPRDCSQPIKEEFLLTGNLEKTNSAYAIAKIAGIELVNSYRKQFGAKWISLMPTNLYGPGDNFDLSSAHVLPAFIRRFVEAADNKVHKVELWGTGSPLREFLHVDDLANAVVLATEKYDSDLHLNIGSGEEITIKNLAKKVANCAGFSGEIYWDHGRPDGTPRKVLDVSRIHSLGWKAKMALDDGIASTIAWYRENSLKGTLRK